MARAVAAHSAGAVDTAAQLCRAVLQVVPGEFNALHLLGVIETALGRPASGRTLIERALAVNPHSAAALIDLAQALNALGARDEAISACDAALAIEPRLPAALNNRGVALAAGLRHDAALADYDAALALQPDQPAILNNRGRTLHAIGRYGDAVASFDHALRIRPDLAIALVNRAAVHNAMGEHTAAVLDCDRALAIQPRDAQALATRGLALSRLRRLDEAQACFGQALSIAPDLVAARRGRGEALAMLGRHDAAQADFAHALAIDPDCPYLPGALLRARLACCDWRDYESLRAGIEAGVRAGRRAIDPFSFLGVSASPADQLACARRFAADQVPNPATPLWAGERYRHDRVRIAYLSADFAGHATAALIADLIALHDRARFEITAISFGNRHVPRDGLARAFDRFVDVRDRADADAASLIRKLEIDIAVDLMGYTTQSRPALLALRPAPVQVLYLGFPGTLGTGSIDYLIADRVVVPESARVHYQEQIVHLPDTYQCNPRVRHMAESVPERSAFGLPDRGFVFCCLNASAKILPPLFTVWMRVLHQVPGSVLWLLAPAGTGEDNLRREAGKRGIDPRRLVFARPLANSEHLARYQRADLFLDTLPYNAHTTASDALWAGLPVLTCPGTSFAGRVGASLLHAIGLPELITPSIAAYEAAAVSLARDPDTLAALRDRLRRNRRTHPLFDADRFRRHIEAAYVGMQALHDHGEPPQGFAVPPLP